MRKFGIGVVIILAVGLLWDTAVQAQAKPAGELKLGVPTLHDQTFHPTWETLYRKIYFEPMYDYIVGIDKDGKFDPNQSIATKWETSADLLSWTFTVREGVKFHNGDPLTAEDVRYTIEKSVSMKNVAGARGDFMGRIDKVELGGPNKVVVKLKKPWPTMLYYLSSLAGADGCVVPAKYIKEKGEQNFIKNPVGSGPYKYHEWKEGNYIKLIALDSHWRAGVPKYRYLTFKLIPEDGTRAAALRSGEIDVGTASIEIIKAFKGDSRFVVQGKKDGLHVGMGYLGTWRQGYPTQNPKVRQALILAINKEALVKEILMGQGRTIGNTTCMFSWAIEYKDYPPTSYDPQTAKKLLAEAGYPNGFPMYMYSFVTYLPEIRMINEAIAGFWEAVGVKTKILDMEYVAFKPVWTNKKDPIGTSAYTMAWPNRPAYSWRSHFGYNSEFDHDRSKEYDKLIADWEKSTTLDAYISSARKIHEDILKNYSGTGLCNTDEIFIMNKNVPAWNMGKGVASYRWEYVGTDK